MKLSAAGLLPLRCPPLICNLDRGKLFAAIIVENATLTDREWISDYEFFHDVIQTGFIVNFGFRALC